MKSLFSALLIFLLAFNWFGYRLLVDAMQQKEDSKLEAQLDSSSYNEADLVEFKIPLNMPYNSELLEYERYNGEVEVNGVFYKYVKRKVANDTLYLKCINNIAKARSESVKDDIFKTTNNLAKSSKNSSGSKTIAFQKVPDFIPYVDGDNVIFNGNNIIVYSKTSDIIIINPSLDTEGKPPRLLS